MEAWDKFLKHLESDLGATTVLKWLHPLKIVRFDACNLYLEATDSFQITWFEEHIRPRVLSLFYNNNKKRIKIHLSLSKNDDSSTQQNKVEAYRTAPKEIAFDSLDPHYCFQEYVEPSESPLPYKILSTLQSNELSTFNPIYIYGESGRGKTHLLMATAAHLRAQGLNALYVKADTFTEHVVSAIRSGEMSNFRQSYRSADALLIDDAQVFARKAATQEEFFHTFNTLHLAGKQIIIAANCAPQELQNVEPRLISRFEWGIVLSLAALKQDELKEMLELKAEALNSPLSDSLITFLIGTFPSGTKALSQALQALILRTHLDDSNYHYPAPNITPLQAASTLCDLIAEEQKNKLTPQKIIQYVCEYFGFLPDDLLGKAQSRDRVLPRQIAMYFCRHELKLPYVKVGEIFSKDHSTVMSSVKLVQNAINNGTRDFTDPLEAIRRRFHQ